MSKPTRHVTQPATPETPPDGTQPADARAHDPLEPVEPVEPVEPAEPADGEEQADPEQAEAAERVWPFTTVTEALAHASSRPVPDETDADATPIDAEQVTDGAADAGSMQMQNGINHTLRIEDYLQTMDEATILQVTAAEVPPADAPAADALTEFILNQLQPVEQIGFLRGSIILLSARIGTSEVHPLDVPMLDLYNLIFQAKLRELNQKNQQVMTQVKIHEDATLLKADEDARLRGFASAKDMQEQLAALYTSIAERATQWFRATEPGGDVTAAPDENALLYDVYRIVNGLSK